MILTNESIVLPVAPQANHRIRFSSYEKTSPALTPEEAVGWTGNLLKDGKRISDVEIKGPGDPLATPKLTFRTLELLSGRYPEIKACVSTIGLGADKCADRLAALGVSHVTVEMQATDPEILKKIYAWVRPGRKTIPLSMVTAMLVESQEIAVRTLVQSGVRVNIRTTVFQGINDSHMAELAAAASAYGADSMELVPSVSKDETEGGDSASCSAETLDSACRQASQHLAVFKRVANDIMPSSMQTGCEQSAPIPKASPSRPNVAVASSNGMDIDLHMGQAHRMLIYGPREDGLTCFLETRPVPRAGTGKDRWSALASQCLHDCYCVLVANAGEAPRKVLGTHGIKVIISSENIQGMVDVLYHGNRKKGKCSLGSASAMLMGA